MKGIEMKSEKPKTTLREFINEIFDGNKMTALKMLKANSKGYNQNELKVEVLIKIIIFIHAEMSKLENWIYESEKN